MEVLTLRDGSIDLLSSRRTPRYALVCFEIISGGYLEPTSSWSRPGTKWHVTDLISSFQFLWPASATFSVVLLSLFDDLGGLHSVKGQRYHHGQRDRSRQSHRPRLDPHHINFKFRRVKPCPHPQETPLFIAIYPKISHKSFQYAHSMA